MVERIDQMTPEERLQWELEHRGRAGIKKSQEYLLRAAEAAKKGDKEAAQNLQLLADLNAADAEQMIFEAGQVDAGGLRDGVIPTMTINTSADPEDIRQ